MRTGVGRAERAPFAFYDGELQMRFESDALGHLSIETEVTAAALVGPMLRFGMSADQSYLPVWSNSLNVILSAIDRHNRVEQQGA